ncbi:MAG: phosphoribosylformylglycinamidine synthase, partial [Verrucomicrobiota bacterium]
AMAMGERTNLAVIDAPASGRMAVGEAITNLAAADIGDIRKIKLSANWMCACGEEGEDANLFDTVKAIGIDLCPQLGLSVPVGKDSLSMRTVWEDEKQIAPLSLIVSAFAPVSDVRKTLTPDLKPGTSALLLIDLGGGKNRLGGSALAQVYNQLGSATPDLDDPDLFGRFYALMQELVHHQRLMAYHDRSDGGLFATLTEMGIAGRRGFEIHLDELGTDPLSILFAEELGAVIQVADVQPVMEIVGRHGLASLVFDIGCPTETREARFTLNGTTVFEKSVAELNRDWSALTWQMQKRRDHPGCADEEYDALLDEADPGIPFNLTWDPSEPFHIGGARPRMAILREQGVNGQVEMAAAFDRAGFTCIDVHMTDLMTGRTNLDDFAGLVACGGFSYGDVLGAGSGWARSILYNEHLKEMFATFFARPETFSLGICNGCQMMSQLRDIIPGTDDWPDFSRNRSEQFEARFVTVEILPSPSIFFQGMEGGRAGVAVAHGEGRADFDRHGSRENLETAGLVSMRYVDHHGQAAERYPLNPNGSPDGVTGFTTADGRATIMMPHPERGFRSIQMSWAPPGIFPGDEGPWLKMFQNARKFVG